MTNRLYVGNLAWGTGEDALIDAFQQDGRTVTSARIMTDRETGRSRGFAFVEMATEEDARAAIEAMDGVEIDGRPLRVNEAQERQPRSGGGHGGGGGGGYGGGGGGGGGGYRDRGGRPERGGGRDAGRRGGGRGGGGGGYDRGDRGGRGGGDRYDREDRW